MALSRILYPLRERAKVASHARLNFGRHGKPSSSFPDDLHEDALRPPSIELPVEDLLPRPEIELAVGDRHDHFPAHDLALEVGVGVVLARAVVVVDSGAGVE